MTSPRDDAGHETSLAVWDLTSPVAVGRRATLKVGVSCSFGCDLAGTTVDVYNEEGARVGGGTLGSQPWLATAALYWVELDVAPAETEGDHSWSVRARTLNPSHNDASFVVPFNACQPPEHRVILAVLDRDSRVPLSGVELRLGRFRTATNDAAIARVEVPSGTYDVGTWKLGYETISKTVAISGNTTIQLELTATPESEQPYWM